MRQVRSGIGCLLILHRTVTQREDELQRKRSGRLFNRKINSFFRAGQSRQNSEKRWLWHALCEAIRSRRCFRRPAKLQPGAIIMADDDIERIPINQLHQEPSAHELATSPEMGPYLNFAMAVLRDADFSAELEAIRKLPLEHRYVWRVASALKW